MTNRYRDFFYTIDRDLCSGMYRIKWQHIDDLADEMEKGGFFSDVPAISYMTRSVDEFYEAMEQLGER